MLERKKTSFLFLFSAAFLATLCLTALAATRRAAASPQIRKGMENAKKFDAKTSPVPFAGIGDKSSDEIAKELENKTAEERLEIARRLQRERLNSDAEAVFRNVVDDATAERDLRIDAMNQYARVMTSRGKSKELESELERILEANRDDWRVMTAVAGSMASLPTAGTQTSGAFVYEIAPGSEVISCANRRRVRRLQILRDALPLVRAEFQEAKTGERAEDLEKRGAQFYDAFISLFNREYWLRQELTNLDALPDYEPQNYEWARNRNQGAPVDANGDPIFYPKPESFETAKNDGERVQALRMEEFDAIPSARGNILRARAQEAKRLFGVETLANYRFFFDSETQKDATAGIWALNTLRDSETIAKLATGVKRFDLPEDYDYLALTRESLEYEFNSGAWRDLAREYESRRQLNKAAEVLQNYIDAITKGNNDAIIMEDEYQSSLDSARAALSQIVDPRASFDLPSSQVRGGKAELVLRSRNATSADISIRKLDVEAVIKQLDDKEAYYSPEIFTIQKRLLDLIEADAISPPTTDVDKTRLEALKPTPSSVVGDEVARIETPVVPDPNHYDVLQKVELPKLPAGAYLVEGIAKDAPKDSKDAILLWIQDVAIVERPVVGGTRYFVVDSESGAPRPFARVEFATFKRSYEGKRLNTSLKRETLVADAEGSLFVETPSDIPNAQYQTFVYVKTPIPGTEESSISILDGVGFERLSPLPSLKQWARAFFVSDRPIYRPSQKARFKFWIGAPDYNAPEKESEYAGKTVACQILSPTGETVAVKTDVRLDSYGAFDDSFDIPDDATLGVYSVLVGFGFNSQNGSIGNVIGSGEFRLEEYRKPEYKVSVEAPKDPVALGDSFKATVRADYYFGAPVADAKVSYTVRRRNYRERWFPPRYWDWFYGRGYWQFACEAKWYPGWSDWGIPNASRPGFAASSGIPEVVATGEGTLDENGTFEIEIDSSFAKALYPDDDQSYEIEAEVVDDSRRAIVGSGKVFAARKPFSTYVWFDRGYYRVGDKIDAFFQARRLDGKPVQGDAVVKLYQVSYEPTDDGTIKPIETEVFAEELKTDDDGRGRVAIAADASGQYRLSCVVSTTDGTRVEGGQLVAIVGIDGDVVPDGKEFHFGDLEVIPDKAEYAPGETAKLQILSNRGDARVVIFPRSERDVVENAPVYLTLRNGVAFFETPIGEADQPNIFVEASTVVDGKLVVATRELAVPPQKRVLDVEIEPEKERVKPGEKTKIKLRLVDPDGKPVVGQTVVSVYDEALDALAGGSNVDEIRSFFWNKKRAAHSINVSNLDRSTPVNAYSRRFPRADQSERMRSIGAFGSFYRNSARLKRRAPLSSAARTRGEIALERGGGMAGISGIVENADASMGVMETTLEAAPAMMAKAAPMAFSAASDEVAAVEEAAGASSATTTEEFAIPETRQNLADVAYWTANLEPGDDGILEIELETPDNLTTWKIAAWSVGKGLRVGSGESKIIATKDVIVRMEKPRFLTRGDEATLSAIVHNYSDEEKKILVSLEFPGTEDDSALVLNDDVAATVEAVAPVGGKRRVDWGVKAVKTGKVAILMKALSSGESDAIQDSLVVNEHGIERQVAYSGAIPPKRAESDPTTRSIRFDFDVPKDRREDSSRLVARFSPTLAGAILDAIPYLTEYPYGCAEQTLNRFLPTVVSRKALIDLGVDLKTIAEKRANLNAQELGDPRERAAQWKRTTRKNPVFDEEESRRLVAAGVAKLQSTQNGDGGWGWFPGDGSISSPRITALVARGLQTARECDQAVDQSVLDRATEWLENYEREQTLRAIRGKVWTDKQKSERGARGLWKNGADDVDAFVYFALSELGLEPSKFSDADVDYERADFGENVAEDPARVHAIMKEALWEARSSLELYTLATYGLALAAEPTADDAATARLETILRVFMEYRKEDAENQTVWLDLNRRASWRWWSWFGAEFETQALYLRLLDRVDGAILEKLALRDDAPRLVKYLLNNRKNATYWNSTRDTAVCVEALAEYLVKTDELNATQKVVVKLDGKEVMTTQYSPENLFAIDGTWEAPSEALGEGPHTLEWVVEGDGSLYCNAYFQYFTLEDSIAKSGLEVKAERAFYKLERDDQATTLVEGGRGQAIDQRVERWKRVPLKSGDALTSGDQVEVEILVESKNDYESIMIRDFKAAGLEPLEDRSGWRYDSGLSSYVEFRDEAVCFFVENLPQGRSKLTYRLRAETPGVFSALPTKVEGMYAPELKGNSDEFKANIGE